MKHIVKGEEPEELVTWKALANEDWQPTYADLQNPEKEAVKKSLMAEQGYICCYCERRLLDDDSHIEHLQPQSDATVDSLDYGNMLCSCQNQIKQGDPRHCGNLKSSHSIPITPFDVDCKNQFTYTHDGEIQADPIGNVSARQTIKTLGLGIPKLNAIRRKVIEPFLDPELNTDDLTRFISAYLDTDQDEYGEFWTTINCLFGA